MANTHEVLEGIKEYTLELLGTGFRDAAKAGVGRSVGVGWAGGGCSG